MLVPFLVSLHVLTVVLWIGGVAFVTVIVFPMLLRMEDTLEMVLAFHRLESKFAKHAKAYVVISGVTGGWLLLLEGRQEALWSTDNIGVLAMIFAWLFYVLVLMFEKRLFARIFGKPQEMDGQKVFRFLTAFHWVILLISLFAVAAGVWQGHGG